MRGHDGLPGCANGLTGNLPNRLGVLVPSCCASRLPRSAMDEVADPGLMKEKGYLQFTSTVLVAVALIGAYSGPGGGRLREHMQPILPARR